jgi:hypothetical protein
MFKTKKVFSIIAVLIVISSLFSVSSASAATKKAFDYELITQSSYPATLAPGATTNVWIEVKNTGTVTWKGIGTENVARLGAGSKFGSANQQRDYTSEFANADWLSANRPVAVMHPEVRPGWHTRFQFNIRAPLTPSVYKAYFTPVVEGVEWMKDIGIYWEITVNDSINTIVDPNLQASQNNSQSGSNITVTSLTLSPNSAVSVKSGTVYDFILIANYSDGSTQTVTALAAWDVVYNTGTGTMMTTIPGRFIAGGMGTCTVTASFQGKSVTSGVVTVTGL